MKKSLWLLSFLAISVSAITDHQANAWTPLLTRVGVGTVIHPIPEPCPNTAGEGSVQPGCGTEHVYIFAINGVDPLCVANFNGLCEHLKKQGFTNTHFAQLYTGMDTTQKIRDIHACDPSARIVLIGFSMGCNRVRCVANRLGQDGIRVDLLAYIAGDSIFATPRSCPDNACRVLNITAHGCIFSGGDLFINGADLPCARNHRLDSRHFQSPSRGETVSLLMEALQSLTSDPACAPSCPPNLYNDGTKTDPVAK